MASDRLASHCAASADPFAQARQYLARVLPWPENPGQAYIDIVWTFMPKDGNVRKDAQGKPQYPWTGWAVSSVQEAINAIIYAQKRENTRDIYACQSSQREYKEKITPTGFKAKKAIRNQPNAVALKSLFLDLAAKGEDKNSYANLSDAVTALAGFIKVIGFPRPSFMVSSGFGLHVYWTMSRALAPDEWKLLAYALVNAAKQHGLKFDSQCTINSARVMRIPNTVNLKRVNEEENDPRPVVIAGTPAGFDYSIECLAKPLEPYKFAIPAAQPAASFLEDPALFPPRPKVADDLGAGIDTRQPVNLDDVARGCAFIRDALVSGGAAYTNPLWNLTTLISTFTESGRADAHRMGNKHPGYTQASTDGLFDRKEREKAEKGLGWPSCQTISASGCTACQACPHFKKGKSPLHWGGRELPLQVTAQAAQSGQDSRAMHVSALPAVPEKRQWLHGTDAIRGAVTLFVAPGGRGKSSWLIVLALACASGGKLLGAHVFGGPLRVLVLSAEDPAVEVARRIRAAMQHHGLKDADLAGLHIVGADAWGLPLLSSVGNVPVPHKPGWDALNAELERINPDIVILDPLMSLMGGVDGNNNSAAAMFMGMLAKLAADRRMAVVVAHHAAKGRDPTSAESAMGAASFVNFARIVLTIEPLSEKDAGRIGIPPWDVRSIFRVLGVKQNFSPADAGDRWFKQVSTELKNAQPPVYPLGDKVGVVEVFKPGTSGAAYPQDVIRDALRALDNANPPLSPSKRATGRYAVDAIAKAVAHHRGGQASDAEATAVLDHLVRSGFAVVQRVKIARAGGRSDERDGLVVTPQGKAAMQPPGAAAAAATPPQSPRTPRGNDAGLQDGGSPKGPRNVPRGCGGNAGQEITGKSTLPLKKDISEIESKQPGAAFVAGDTQPPPSPLGAPAPTSTAAGVDLAVEAIPPSTAEPVTPSIAASASISAVTSPTVAPSVANPGDLTIPDFLRRPLPGPAVADVALRPDSSADLTIKPR